MIPRKPNLLITQLSDKRLPCPANRSSRAGKVEGSRKILSKRRLRLVLGKPLFSALIGATKQWIIPSGTNSGGKDREMCSSPVFCLIALNHKPREFCLHILGSKVGRASSCSQREFGFILPGHCTVWHLQFVSSR